MVRALALSSCSAISASPGPVRYQLPDNTFPTALIVFCHPSFPPALPKEPHHQYHGADDPQRQVKVRLEQTPDHLYDTFTILNREQAKDKETNKASRKDGQQEMAEVHFESRCREHEELEGCGRGQHGGKH